MTRTTLDLDPSILEQLHVRRRRERKSLGRLVSELLTTALQEPPPAAPEFTWAARPMRSRIDLEDKDAVRRAVDPR